MGRVTEQKRAAATDEQRKQVFRRRSTKSAVLRPIPRERPFNKVPIHPTMREAVVVKPTPPAIRAAFRCQQQRSTPLRPISRTRPLKKVSEQATESDGSMSPGPDQVMAEDGSGEDKALPPLSRGVGSAAPYTGAVDASGRVTAIMPAHPLKPFGRPPRQEPYRMLREEKPTDYKYLDKYTKEELTQIRRRTFEERAARMERRFRELRLRDAPIILRGPLKITKPTTRQRKARASRKRDSEVANRV